VCNRTTCGPKSRSGRLWFRQRKQRLARFALHVGGIDDRQQPGRQPLAGDIMQHLERILRSTQAVLIVADEAAAEVRREHLGRFEMLASKSRLSGAGSADKNDEGEVGNSEFHFTFA